MKLDRVRSLIPDWKNVILAAVSAVLLVLAFPPFELWFTAWFALAPLLWGIGREGSVSRSFTLGWLCGNIFFFATCWWLTFAPITYAGFPAALAYFLLFIVTSTAAGFVGMFAAITAFLVKRFGPAAFFAVPFVWIFSEFARYWVTGNNWNAIGYSQAFSSRALWLAQIGGVWLVGFLTVVTNAIIALILVAYRKYLSDPEKAPYFVVFLLLTIGWPVLASRSVRNEAFKTPEKDFRLVSVGTLFAMALIGLAVSFVFIRRPFFENTNFAAVVIAVQPNVPMAGLSTAKWQQLRRRHSELAEASGTVNIDKFVRRDVETYSTPKDPSDREAFYRDFYAGKIAKVPRLVIFPESPMNFMYDDDPETQEFINGFATRNNVSVLFNSAEPDKSNGKYFNSAVMVGPEGKEIAQYDKIFLLPFGEAVPFPLEGLLPGFVGNFSYGREYDLLPLGDAKAGVMICFESHFGQLSREYVRNGADAIIEMTNDGYLGPTPVLRQHLANAVFRAVETNRPVLRVTNVGITAYVNERGEVLDAAEPYTEATRVWSVAKSDGSQTFYVKYGDWFAWLSSIVTIGVLLFGLVVRKPVTKPVAEARTE